MNPNELKMYTALQPMIKKAMGEWPLVGDKYIHDGKEFYFGGALPTFTESSIIIRIPLPIDPVNPDRGLFEMLKWGRKVFVAHSSDFFNYTHRGNPQGLVCPRGD